MLWDRCPVCPVCDVGVLWPNGWIGLRVRGHLAFSLHSSNEPGELWQWPRHDDSTINIVIGVSIIIIGHNSERASRRKTQLYDEPVISERMCHCNYFQQYL